MHFSWIVLREFVERQVVIQYTRSVSIPNSCKGSRTVSETEETFACSFEDLAQALGDLDFHLVAFLATLITKALHSV